MRIDKVMLVFNKDWREIKRNKEVILPIIVLPFIFSIVLPFIISMIPAEQSDIGGLALLLANLPDYARTELQGMTNSQVIKYVMLVYFLAPFLLIIPIMASSVIAADSFAGEKERKTIEALLATPISDSELFLGKVLVSFIPSMMVTVLAFAVYSAVVDVSMFTATGGRLLLPNMNWALTIFLLSPALAMASISLTVMVSARVRGFREAQQISAVLLLPILGLVFSQITGIAFFGPIIILGLTAVLTAAAVIIFRVSVKVFGREQILQRLT